MAKYKLIKRQDAGLKITAGNSGETSINLSHEIADFLCGEVLSSGVTLELSFTLYKEDFVKAICLVIEKLPLYTTSSQSYKTINNVLSIYEDLAKQMESFFGGDEQKKYTCSILKKADGRVYLNGLRQDKFSIRNFLIEETTYLKFEKYNNDISIRLIYDTSAEKSEELIVSNNVIRSFVFACIEYFSKTNKWKNIEEYLSPKDFSAGDVIKVTDNEHFRLTGMFRCTTEDELLTYNTPTRRWYSEPFIISDKTIFLSTEWYPDVKSNGQSYSLMMTEFMEFVSICFGNEYICRYNNGTYELWKITSASITGEDQSSPRQLDLPLQQIFYGAPGTGKSHGVKETTDKIASEFVFRTTFHPDSDYSTFVGAYKPTMKELPRFNPQTGDKIGVEEKIVYSFVPQAFLKAYVTAWKNPNQAVFLVIEEINRGNCAQIFGDIFQLLDRKDGVSEYPIKADQDIQDLLAKEFANVDGLKPLIQSGEEMALPSNLHIWATMNTSDQSLFPIDSAFKRRWDWKYVPIKNANENWSIKARREYDWWSFLAKINAQINDTTSSEDKKLGYFFCKPDESNTTITAERFVNKVIFYLWNDVFKDYDMSHEAFKDENNKRLSFGNFFNMDSSANEGVVDDFLTKLGVAEKSSNTEAQTGNGESTPELEEVYKEYWKRFEPYAKNKGYTFKAGAPYSHTYALDNVTYIVELPHGNGKNDWTKMLKLAVQMGPMEQGKLEDMKKSLPDGFMIDNNGYGSRLERRFDNVNKENLADSASDVIFELLINELKNMINIIETNNPSSAQ